MEPINFRCPICGRELSPVDRRLVCPGRHSFDLAKSGYVNLLPPSAAKIHGDNREMIAARHAFLEAGYYAPLRDALCVQAAKHLPPEAILLDAGCGEGYYTAGIANALPGATLYGIDLSKDALIFAARRKCGARLAAASVYKLPFADGEIDGVISVFSPFAGEEFRRVLRTDGLLLMVIPTERHLLGLKAALYERPYENRVAPTDMEGWERIERQDLSWTAVIEEGRMIDALFRMTPYFYRTRPADREKLAGLDRLETEFAFALLIYRKTYGNPGEKDRNRQNDRKEG